MPVWDLDSDETDGGVLELTVRGGDGLSRGQVLTVWGLERLGEASTGEEASAWYVRRRADWQGTVWLARDRAAGTVSEGCRQAAGAGGVGRVDHREARALVIAQARF